MMKQSKKTILIPLLFVLLVLIALAVYLCISFFQLYGEAKKEEQSPTQVEEHSNIEAFLVDNWHFARGEYDPLSQTATGIKSYDLTLAQAQEVGGSVFAGELAPETYLPQALTIAADLSTRFSCPEVTVVISARGSDGEEIFRVDSKGDIWTCWDGERQAESKNPD